MWREITALREVMADADRPAAEAARLAETRLKAVLIQAHAKVPLHRRHMAAAGYDPRVDFRGPRDLTALPILTKAMVKQTPIADLVSGDVADRLDDLFTDATSGSTGTPLRVYREPRERARQIAKWLRVLFHNGYRPWHKVMSFTATSRLGAGASPLQRLGLFRRQPFNYTRRPAEAADAFLAYRPHAIYGVKTSIRGLAEELDRRGQRPRGLRLVVMGGEVIRGADRAFCERVLGVPVIESYGAVETGVMAYQRGAGGRLTLVEDLTWFEFLDDDGRPAAPGVAARVVVTDLAGRAMPLIRYEIGDRVVIGRAEGTDAGARRWIERIIGRDDDIAPLPSGATLNYLDFYEIMEHFPAIRRFRFHQRARDRIEVLVEAAPEALAAARADLLAALRRAAGEPVRFEIREVDALPPDPGGKIRILVSDLAPGRTG